MAATGRTQEAGKRAMMRPPQIEDTTENQVSDEREEKEAEEMFTYRWRLKVKATCRVMVVVYRQMDERVHRRL